MTYWLDTSALVKRYVNEVGSGWVTGLFGPATRHDIALVALAAVEMVSALTRKVRTGELTAAQHAAALASFRADGGDYYWLAVDPLIQRAEGLAEQHGLRAYDAVQLAGCLEVRDRLTAAGLGGPTFVSADRDLLAAAQAVGLAIEDPRQHP